MVQIVLATMFQFSVPSIKQMLKMVFFTLVPAAMAITTSHSGHNLP
jgi:hypothetical protein